MYTPHNGMSPATPTDLLDGITQIMNRVTNDNKRDDASKKMMKKTSRSSTAAIRRNASHGSAK